MHHKQDSLCLNDLDGLSFRFVFPLTMGATFSLLWLSYYPGKHQRLVLFAITFVPVGVGF